MRWGVTDELMNDHQVSELCIREIAMCQQLSCGPNFVAFLGNRYGHRPFPSVISASVFELFIQLIEETYSAGTELLKEWFIKDENAVPAVYILQSIASKLPHYHDNDPDHKDNHVRDKALWNQCSDTIQAALRQAARSAIDKGFLEESDVDEYFISVTEQEIQMGILMSENAEIKTYCVKRKLPQLEKDTTNPKIIKFIDLNPDGSIDQEAKDLLTQLTDDKIPKQIPQNALPSFDVEWKGKALEESEEADHIEYLERFSEMFVEKIKEKIDICQILDKALDKTTELGSLYFEVLHHAKFAIHKCKLFCGQKEALSLVKNYLFGDSQCKTPFLIHGKSGYGKTSLLAYIAKTIWNEVDCKCVVVLRHLGTSPLSSNILQVIQSIMYQIKLTFNLPHSDEEPTDKLGQLKRMWWDLLATIGKKFANRKLFILLDSVDQLADTYGAHQMHWIPRSLPDNVKIVISVLSEKERCLSNALERIHNDENVFELGPMPEEIGEMIIDQYMRSSSRQLTPDQNTLVKKCFQACPQPLLLKLALDKACKWHSYTTPDSIVMPSTVHEAIMLLFESLELKFGTIFVPHCLGFLTCSKGGLTGLEMEDLLSSDDQVLNEVYKYHDPPLAGVIRIPSLMWARVQDELKEYLVERQVYGKTVMTWYHRQFWEAAEVRYLSDQAMVEYFHTILAELFSQTKGIQRTIILEQRKGKVIHNADRKVAPQPLVPRNIRKLSCLPYHLLHAKALSALKEECMINFQWLKTKLEGTGINEILREFEFITETELFGDDQAIGIMADFLEVNCSALRVDFNSFSFLVCERLSPFAHLDKTLEKLLDEAKFWLSNTDAPLLVPVHPMNFAPLDSPLKMEIIVGRGGILSHDSTKFVCTSSSINYDNHKVNVLDLKGRDITASFSIRKVAPLCVTRDNKYFGFVEGMSFKLFEIESGDRHRQWMYSETAYESVTARAIAVSNSGRYIAFASRCSKPAGIEDDTQWKTQVIVGIVDLENVDSKPHTTSFPSKKAIDTISFSGDELRLIATSREKVYIFVVPDLEILQKIKSLPPLHGSSALLHLPDCTTMVIGAKLNRGCQIVVFDYSTCESELSDSVHTLKEEAGEDAEPFGICSKSDISSVVFGTTTKRKNKHSFLWQWNRDDSIVKKIPIGVGEWKTASMLLVRENWDQVFVGWYNGDLTVVSLSAEQECYKVPMAHSHSVLSLYLFDGGEKLLTSSLDNTVKVWKTRVIYEAADKALLKTTDDDQKSSTSDENLARPTILNADCQCVNFAVIGDHLATVNHLNDSAPQFWCLENGALNEDMTERHQALYTSSLKENKIKFGNRGHAVLSKVGSYLVSKVMTRDTLTVYVTSYGDNLEVVAHKMRKPSFFSLLKPLHEDSQEPRLISVRDGFLDEYNMSLDVVQSSEIPKITDDVPNIFTGGGLKKLLNYRNGITVDNKYFVIINPSVPRSKGGKYFDVVNLQEGQYLERVRVKWLSWRVLIDSFYFLVWMKGESSPGVHTPSFLHHLDKKCSYKCVIESSTSCLSEDRTVGFELMRNYSVRVWRVTPLKRLCSLHGHTSEVTSGHISRDNNFLVTGSGDNTVRLWSLRKGQQVSVFYLFGKVDRVIFDPSITYVIVQSFTAPQRVRAVILKMLNVQRLLVPLPET